MRAILATLTGCSLAAAAASAALFAHGGAMVDGCAVLFAVLALLLAIGTFGLARDPGARQQVADLIGGTGPAPADDAELEQPALNRAGRRAAARRR